MANRQANESSSTIFTRSTIYKRHEARLMRNETLHDDPRPTPVRMLSRLPGARSFFLPYNPRIHGSKRQQQQSLQHQSNHTAFVSQQHAMNSSNLVNDLPTGIDTTISQPLQSFLAGAVSAGASFALLAPPFTGANAASPFVFAAATTTTSGFVTPSYYTTPTAAMVRFQATGATTSAAPPVRPSGGAAFVFPSSPSFAHHSAMALTTVRLTVHDTVTQSTESPLLGSLTAAFATSGASLWLRQWMRPMVRRSMMIPTATAATARAPIVASTLLAREFATTLLYCGLWEYGGHTSNSLLVVATGGLAGYVVHRTVRAVPLHAMVFVGYNALRPTAENY